MKRLIITLILTSAYIFGGLFINLASAAGISCSDTSSLSAKQQIECGACSAAGSVDSSGNVVCNPGASTGSVQTTIKTVVNILSAAAGIAAVIMIIVGGLRYITSAGNPDAAKGAKNTILYAVVGLIIVALAQIIVHFAIHTVTPTTKTTMNNTNLGSLTDQPAITGTPPWLTSLPVIASSGLTVL